MPKIPAGVLPVLATPFNQDGDIDGAALASEIDFVIQHQAHGVVLGMVSEILRLSSEERDALAEVACQAASGRVTVTTSVGAESLYTAIRHGRRCGHGDPAHQHGLRRSGVVQVLLRHHRVR